MAEIVESSSADEDVGGSVSCCTADASSCRPALCTGEEDAMCRLLLTLLRDPSVAVLAAPGREGGGVSAAGEGDKRERCGLLEVLVAIGVVAGGDARAPADPILTRSLLLLLLFCWPSRCEDVDRRGCCKCCAVGVSAVDAAGVLLAVGVESS